jgi:hypothetical protein
MKTKTLLTHVVMDLEKIYDREDYSIEVNSDGTLIRIYPLDNGVFYKVSLDDIFKILIKRKVLYWIGYSHQRNSVYLVIH